MLKYKFIQAHMKAAEVYAQLSSAKRLQVGCVIVKNDTIIGIGYNGMPSGWTNECEDENFVTKSEVLHAEQNAISKIAKSTNSSEDAALFVTHAPCIHCAKSIYQAGIVSVFYRDEYKDPAGVEFLKKCGVYVEQIESV